MFSSPNPDCPRSLFGRSVHKLFGFLNERLFFQNKSALAIEGDDPYFEASTPDPTRLNCFGYLSLSLRFQSGGCLRLYSKSLLLPIEVLFLKRK